MLNTKKTDFTLMDLKQKDIKKIILCVFFFCGNCLLKTKNIPLNPPSKGDLKTNNCTFLSKGDVFRSSITSN